PGSRPARRRRRGGGQRRPGPLAGPAARGHRALPLSGTVEHRGRGADGNQRRGPGEPAVAWTAGVEGGAGRASAGRRRSMNVMTAERFLTLTAAYGADRRRWPEGERAAAEAFAARHAGIAGPALDEADSID